VWRTCDVGAAFQVVGWAVQLAAPAHALWIPRVDEGATTLGDVGLRDGHCCVERQQAYHETRAHPGANNTVPVDARRKKVTLLRRFPQTDASGCLRQRSPEDLLLIQDVLSLRLDSTWLRIESRFVRPLTCLITLVAGTEQWSGGSTRASHRNIS
jgi:hypothetical protein